MSVVVGIDPGLRGGIAIYQDGVYENFLLSEFSDTYAAFKELMGTATHIFLEKAEKRPMAGVVSTATTWYNFGRLKGWIESLYIPFTLVPSAQWTKEMCQGTDHKETKGRSLQAARRLFPNYSFLATPKCSIPHDGLYESMLICEYGRRKLGIA